MHEPRDDIHCSLRACASVADAGTPSMIIYVRANALTLSLADGSILSENFLRQKLRTSLRRTERD